MQEKKYYNPFIFRTPVRGKHFFGRDDLLGKIFDCIDSGESVSLVGEQRTGKTSVLWRVLDLKEQFLSQPGQHAFALLDFGGQDYRSQTDIWVTLLTELLEETALAGLETQPIARAIKQLQSGEHVFPTVPRLFRTLGNSGIKITFLFDEFEATAEGKNPVDLSFYKLLRNLATDRRAKLTYIIGTSQELSKIEKHLEQQFTTLSSPLFNIFHRLVVPPLSENAAKQMVDSLLKSTDLSPSTMSGFWQQWDLLFQLSGFHPFFLQRACYYLFEHCILPDGAFSDSVPKDTIMLAFLNEARPDLSYHWEKSSEKERRLMRQLATEQNKVDFRFYRTALNKLKNRCLVVREAGAKSRWQLFSIAFARWIREETIEAEYVGDRALLSITANGVTVIKGQATNGTTFM